MRVLHGVIFCQQSGHDGSDKRDDAQGCGKPRERAEPPMPGRRPSACRLVLLSHAYLAFLDRQIMRPATSAMPGTMPTKTADSMPALASSTVISDIP